MKAGLTKIIEKVCILWYFGSPEIDLHIAENACCIGCAHTWSSKRVHWLAKSQCSHCGTTNYGYEDTVVSNSGVARARLPTTGIHTSSGSKIQNTLITDHLSHLKMSGPLWSMTWKYWGHFNIGPCGCQRGIQSHNITLLQCTMTCLITWIAWCQLWPRRRLHGRMTCSPLWS